jgi:phospholipase/carboxylesterase
MGGIRPTLAWLNERGIIMHKWKIYHQAPASGAEPKSAVLMMHGVGSNGQDLINLAPYLAQSLPDTLFLSPDAPQPYDIVPGMMMENAYQWFSLQNRDPDILMEQATQSFDDVNELIDKIAGQYNLDPSRIALLGFSQGTMMAFFTALRRATPLAGVLGYSGMILDDDGFESMQKTPVCLIHGEDDDVVPFAMHQIAVDRLRNAGLDVDALSIPGLPHSIDQAGIDRGAAFLKRVLG